MARKKYNRLSRIRTISLARKFVNMYDGNTELAKMKSRN